MVCADETAAAEARAALPGEVDVIVEPIDDSWLRDSGPIFVTGIDGRRAGVHFGFNAWGEKFEPFDKDAAIGGRLVELIGDPCLPRAADPRGRLDLRRRRGHADHDRAVPAAPEPQPGLSREQIERQLIDAARRWSASSGSARASSRTATPTGTST